MLFLPKVSLDIRPYHQTLLSILSPKINSLDMMKLVSIKRIVISLETSVTPNIFLAVHLVIRPAIKATPCQWRISWCGNVSSNLWQALLYNDQNEGLSMGKMCLFCLVPFLLPSIVSEVSIGIVDQIKLQLYH